jgi:hypothetical protein
MQIKISGAILLFHVSACIANELNTPLTLSAQPSAHGWAVKPPPPIGLVDYTGLDAALAMSKPQKSTQFLRLFTRGTETALTRKEDVTAKIRVKPNGESSVSLTFRYD